MKTLLAFLLLTVAVFAQTTNELMTFQVRMAESNYLAFQRMLDSDAQPVRIACTNLAGLRDGGWGVDAVSNGWVWVTIRAKPEFHKAMTGVVPTNRVFSAADRTAIKALTNKFSVVKVIQDVTPATNVMVEVPK